MPIEKGWRRQAPSLERKIWKHCKIQFFVLSQKGQISDFHGDRNKIKKVWVRESQGQIVSMSISFSFKGKKR